MSSPTSEFGDELSSFDDGFNLNVPLDEPVSPFQPPVRTTEDFLKGLQASKQSLPAAEIPPTTSASRTPTVLPTTTVAESGVVTPYGLVPTALPATTTNSLAVTTPSSWAQPTAVRSTTTTTSPAVVAATFPALGHSEIGDSYLDFEMARSSMASGVSNAEAVSVVWGSQQTTQRLTSTKVATPLITPVRDAHALSAPSSSATAAAETLALGSGDATEVERRVMQLMARAYPLVGELHTIAADLMAESAEHRLDEVLTPLLQHCRSRQGSERASWASSPVSAELGDMPFRPPSSVSSFRGRRASTASSRSSSTVEPYSPSPAMTAAECCRALVRLTVAAKPVAETSFCADVAHSFNCSAEAVRGRLRRCRRLCKKEDGEIWERALFAQHERYVDEGELERDAELDEAITIFKEGRGF